MCSHRRISVLVALAVIFLASAAIGQSPPSAAVDLTELSLEQLLETKITSVSRRPESVFRSAAAVYVITDRDIERSGARSLPDLLRLVPGLHVARVQASSWAITARGFNGTTANKLQVLIDDRSLYSPLTSGVFWDVQAIPVEEIERIEVIRGPGATLWGANAVNGVINIITKKAAATQGGFVRLGVGTEQQLSSDIRWGGQLESGAFYRVAARHSAFDGGKSPGGGTAADDWNAGWGGFRLDGSVKDGQEWTLSGAGYSAAANSVVNRTLPSPPFRASSIAKTELGGGHLLGRWASSKESGTTTLRAYVEQTDRQIPSLFGEVRTTFDIELQRTRALGSKQHLVYGAGYRVSSDDVSNSFTISWDPKDRSFEILNAYFQDELRSKSGRAALTLGAKLEHHEFVEFEFQPNVRFSWQGSPNYHLWAAVSRAVRTPSRLDHEARFNALVVPGEPNSIFALVGNDGFAAETLIASEAGFRVRPRGDVQFSAAVFHHDYDNLLSVEGPGPPFLEDEFLIVPFELSNLVLGSSHGIEFDFSWEASTDTRVKASASYFDLNLATRAGSTDQMTEQSEGNDPSWQAQLGWSHDWNERIQLDATARYVGRLAALNVNSYLEADCRAAWQASDSLELELVGRNLLNSAHREYGADASLVERSVSVALAWRTR